MSENRVRIGIIEDDRAFRDQLVTVLHAQTDWKVVGQWERIHDALTELSEIAPDLILLDVRLGGESAIDFLLELKQQLPKEVPIVMLTVMDRLESIIEAFRNGAASYIVKGGAPEQLIAKIQDVLDGGAAMSPAVANKVIQWIQSDQKARAIAEQHRLTEREWEILKLAAKGQQAGEIASSLGIALSTVKNHFRKIYEKLQVNSLNDALIKLKAGKSLLDEH